MQNGSQLRVILLLVGMLLPVCATAQNVTPPSEPPEMPLGDLVRLTRKNLPPSSKTIIDNENMAQLLDQVESQRQRHSMLFSFDAVGKNFQISPSPDVTCSLSFNAKATSLLASPLIAQDLPVSELAKLEGPATLKGDMLQVSVFNGTGWDLREITVGLTIVRRAQTATPDYSGAIKLLPTIAGTTLAPEEKHPDMTVLYHIKGKAVPASITVFQQALDSFVDPNEEWHWAIVAATGIPPAKTPVNPAASVISGLN